MSEVQYWSEFYASKASTTVPPKASSFAEFVSKWISHDQQQKKKTLIDLGCGTGRDTKFFASKLLQVIGIDQAPTTIEKNNQDKSEFETYLVGDFAHIAHKECEQADYLYSRFSVHSICKQDASDLYAWAASPKGLKSKGLFFIEARSINDPLYKQGTPDPHGDPDASISGHYRRFIRLDALVQELKELGFSILYKDESDNLSVCGDDNPVLVRVICQKP